MRAMHAGLATFFRPEDIRIANLAGALSWLVALSWQKVRHALVISRPVAFDEQMRNPA
jgi:hypothetical protein